MAPASRGRAGIEIVQTPFSSFVSIFEPAKGSNVIQSPNVKKTKETLSAIM